MKTVQTIDPDVSIDSIIYIQKVFKKNISSLQGEYIIIKRSNTDNPIEPSEGIIRNIILDEKDPKNIEKARFQTHDRKYGTNHLFYFQFELLKVKKLSKNDIMSFIIESIYKGKNSEIKTKEKRVIELSDAIKEKEDHLHKLIESFNKEEETLSLLKSKSKKYSSEDLYKEISMIKNLENVERAYISNKGNILVITKHLEAYNTEKEQVEDKDIGRFVIKYTLRHSRGSIYIENMDYKAEERSHPNGYRDGTTCWGDNSGMVYDMLYKGKLFHLTDFIITFISLFPQDGGLPNMGYMDWIKKKVKIKFKKTFIEEEI